MSEVAQTWAVTASLLASSKMSGSSLASFSLATSAIGPKITTGLRKPAVQEKDHIMTIATLQRHQVKYKVNITFPQHHPLIGRELGLDRLGWQILPALPQISLRASQASESPEVGPVAAWCFGESVLHTGKLLRSGQTRVRAESWGVGGSNDPDLVRLNCIYGVMTQNKTPSYCQFQWLCYWMATSLVLKVTCYPHL